MAAIFAVVWQAAAGPLEHLGIVPHAHQDAASSDSGKAGSHAGDHHHLPDAAIFSPTHIVFLSCGVSIQESSLVPFPDGPVFGIVQPPRLA